MINDAERLELVREAVQDWRATKLSSYAAMMAIAIIMRTKPPCDAVMKFARSVAPTIDLQALQQE